jgi:chloramphenicol 3-O-phosphotransferase
MHFYLFALLVVISSQAIPGCVKSEAKSGQLVIINGVSSCGKSQTAKELQSLLAKSGQPFALLPFDDFTGMLPKPWVNLDSNAQTEVSADGMRFVIQTDKVGPKVVIQIGDVARRLRSTAFSASEAIVSSGNNLIFEGVIFPDEFVFAMEKLKAFNPLRVKVKCSSEVAQKRERERKGFIGLSRGIAEQIDPIPETSYDLIVDTSLITTHEAAQQVFEKLKKGKT